ncbi:hypothetical protein [Streptomyces sp. NPDC058622]|uniref:hypothetical protein n=1 Tax=Streptomyces sp. NPDC058622 TaxID=3346562 RepID=UPI003654AF38
MDPAAAVGSAVVDFDGGGRLVDVDAADEGEVFGSGSGDSVDGQGGGVQRMCGLVQTASQRSGA